MSSLLEVDHLTVNYDGALAVSDVSFSLEAGQVLGLVGESGSGKTTTALSLLGHRVWGGKTSGNIRFRGQDILTQSPDALQALRGRHMAYVPQNPTTALNPVRTIGSLFGEHLAVHRIEIERMAARHRSVAALHAFGFSDAPRVLDCYAHQLSGGQQQRVVLALATLCDPAILVLDEPTTGLDVSTQAVVLELLRNLRRTQNTAMIYVTHDLAVLSEIATHVCVLYAGKAVEIGPVSDVFGTPRHPYTRALIASRPNISDPQRTISALRGVLRREDLRHGCPFAPRCDLAVPACRTLEQVPKVIGRDHSVACMRWDVASQESIPGSVGKSRLPVGDTVLRVAELTVSYRTTGLFSLRRKALLPAVQAISLELRAGEIVAVVGESGSGKSSLAKAIAGLVTPRSGRIELKGKPLAGDARSRTKKDLRTIQLVFQNPDASLNPRRRIGETLALALASFERPGTAETVRRIAASLAEVNLPETYLARYPDQLSGGERQRVAIARALIVNPDVLICDEVLSALDVSVQAGILSLLKGIASSRAMAILFISHDLAVVRSVADTVLLLYRGQLMASLPASRLLSAPFHPYVFTLLAAIPSSGLTAAGPRTAVAPSRPANAIGCSFGACCPVRIDPVCGSTSPPPHPGASTVYCHHSSKELRGLFQLTAGCGLSDSGFP